MIETLEDRAVPATINWDGGPAGMGTNWLDAANWVGDVLPGANDDAVVALATAGQPTTLMLTGDANVRSASVSRTLELTAGTLTAGAGTSTFGVFGSVDPGLVLAGGALNPLDGATIADSMISGPGTITLPAGRTLIVTHSVVHAPLVNNGTLLARGQAWFDGGFVAATGSRLQVTPTATSGTYGTIVNSIWTNHGVIDVHAESGLSPSIGFGYLTNASDGRLLVSGGSTHGSNSLAGRLNNQGYFEIGAGGARWNSFVDLTQNTGTMSVLGGDLELTSLTLSQFTSMGTINVAAGRSFTITAGPTFTNFSNNTLTGGTYNIAGNFGFRGAAIRTLDAALTLDGPGSTITNVDNSSDGLAQLTTIRVGGQFTLLNGRAYPAVVPPPGGVFNSGILRIGAGSAFNGSVANTGVVAGSGVVGGILNNGDGGTLQPGDPVGRLSVMGDFVNSGSTTGGNLVVDLSGLSAGTDYDQIIANLRVLLGGQLTINAGFVAARGDSFRIIDNRGTSPVSGTFTGQPEGATLTTGGQHFRISYAGGDGNDVTLTAVDDPAVAQVAIGDGTAQRSRISQLQVTFDRVVTFASDPVAAFRLQRIVGGAPAGNVTLAVNTATVLSRTVATLTFVSDTTFGSLNDGRYRLTVFANQIMANGTPMAVDHVTNFHRFFGDVNGDGRIDIADFGYFSSSYKTQAGSARFLAYLDYDGDGRIDVTDFGQFSVRYFTALP